VIQDYSPGFYTGLQTKLLFVKNGRGTIETSMAKNTPNPGRVPPQSLDSEKALLGAILLRPQALYETEDILSPEAFYADKHRIIFMAMQELATRHEPIDLLSLTNRLKEQGSLERIGGSAYIAELVENVPASTNARYYADIVVRKATLRSLIDAGEYVSELGFTETGDEIEDTLDKAEKKVFEISSGRKTQRFVPLRDTLTEAWTRIETLHEKPGEMRGVPTGFQSLDNLLAGLQNSDLIILAARPSVGKTTLALDIARLAATRHNIPVGIFSLEMGAQQLVDRMLAAEAGVNAWNLRTGRLSKDNEFTSLRDALDRLSKAPIFIEDESSNTISKMRAFARRLKAEHGLGLIVVDYLQLMGTSKNYDSMVNQVTEISRSLKGLARDLNVPVLALSQLSRAVESRGGEPRLSDLRDSGSIEQDADVVMFIHSEDRFKEKEERTNITKIIVAKHRNGPVGEVELYFDQKRTTFMDLDKNSAEGFNASHQAAPDPFGGAF
jgi:replicative DNA helicase